MNEQKNIPFSPEKALALDKQWESLKKRIKEADEKISELRRQIKKLRKR